MTLYQDHLYLDESIMHERVHDLLSRNMKPTYRDLQTVPSSSGDWDYLVAKVGCLDTPFAEADVSEDRVEIVVCSCDDFYFNRSDGLETDRQPSTIGQCKHIQTAYKVERAKHDDQQETL